MSGRLLTILLILGLFAGAVPSRGDGGFAGSYLRIGVGTRALGIGAFTAVADDGSCLHWNPAGLGQLTQHEFDSQTTLYSLGRAHNFLSYAHALKKYGTLSLGIINYSSGNDIERRTGNSFVPEGTFADSQNAVLVSWGKEIVRGWNLGITVKTLFQDLYDQRAFGLGGDAGLLWQAAPDWSLGLTLQDIYSYLNWSQSGWTDVFPFMTRLGAAWRFDGRKGLAAADLELPLKGATAHWGLGGEYALSKNFSLRGGLRDLSPVTGFGVWFPFSTFMTEFDYALGFDGIDPASAIHRFTLRLTFDRWSIDL